MRPDSSSPKNHAHVTLCLHAFSTSARSVLAAIAVRRAGLPFLATACTSPYSRSPVLALLVVNEHEHLRRADDADGRREELEPDVPLLLRRDAQAALLEREELGAVCRQVEHAVVRVRVRQGYLRSGRPRF